MLPTKNFKGLKFFLRNASKEFSFTQGTLVLSHWELLFYSNDGTLDVSETYNCLASVEKRRDQNNFFIEFFFKNFKNWILSLPDEATLEEFSRVLPTYRSLKGDGSLEANVPAFSQNVTAYDIEENGWDTYNAERELQRLFMPIDDKDNKWRITSINSNYEICDSYPAIGALPRAFDETKLKAAAEHRDLGRFPGFSWIHPDNHTVIVRCSQPLSGRLGNIRCPEDEELIQTIFATNTRKPIHQNRIIDARPFSNAMANRYKGAGFETKEFYQGCEVEFMDIENIHAMRQSLDKVRKLCRSTGPNDPSNTWLSRLEASSWLTHIQLCMKASIRISRMVCNGVSVLIHCSHGWDRTAQLSSLAQVIMDPYYRTIRGFEQLIEKEWVSFGHRITDRGGHLSSVSSEENEEESPIFPQFLDCVHQLLVQFPTQFAYNEQFLIAILDGFYDCRYGTFLSNSEKEKNSLMLREKTISLWTHLNHASNIEKFQNPLYDLRKVFHVLTPSAAPNKIVFWSGLYDRSEAVLSPPPSSYVHQSLADLVEAKDKYQKRLEKALEVVEKYKKETTEKDNMIQYLLEKLGMSQDQLEAEMGNSKNGGTQSDAAGDGAQ